MHPNKRAFILLFITLALISGGLLMWRFGVSFDVGRFFASTPTDPELILKAIDTEYWGDTNYVGTDEEIAVGRSAAVRNGNRQEFISAKTGSLFTYMAWRTWEPTNKLASSAPCDATLEFEFEGHCYTIDWGAESQIKYYSDNNINVFVNVILPPAWAQVPEEACPHTATNPVPLNGGFCATSATHYADLARFARMIATRYDGNHGHGKITDFIYGNEVNATMWFNIGNCGGAGSSSPCDYDQWAAHYAAEFATFYDAIKSVQPNAKVFVCLSQGFWSSANVDNFMGGETFLLKFAPLVGDRQWSVAWHPYSTYSRVPTFSPYDVQGNNVTFGNIGTIVGWLMKTFPNLPSAHRVYLTESGFTANPDNQEELTTQDRLLCNSYRNVLGTPGIEVYMYHRMVDHPQTITSTNDVTRSDPGPTLIQLFLGLRKYDGTPKPAWNTWVSMNQPGTLNCGFEDLPYTRLTRSFKSNQGHWVSTRIPPSGYTTEMSWRLFRHPQPGTAMLYECYIGGNNYVTRNATCDGNRPLGPLGYVYTAPTSGAVALYSCQVGESNDYFVSEQSNCGNYNVLGLLGYAIPPASTGTSSKPGDLNGDGAVTAADLNALVAVFGKTSDFGSADLVADNKVDIYDYNELVKILNQ